MEFLTKYRSLNFNNRSKKSIIKYIVLHYTAMHSDKEAIKHLILKKSKVSCHYLVNKKGHIFDLVDDQFRAWHAGVSFWNGIIDINSYSIGIELDNSGSHLDCEKYTQKQIKSLINLIKLLQKKYRIKKNCILSHSDIAPYRKVDPGKNFPWNKLFINKVSKLFSKSTCKKLLKIEKYFYEKKIKYKKEKIIYMLARIGYDTSLAKKNNKYYKKLIKSYQMHFIRNNVNGVGDKKTYETLINHFNEELTI
jgi:N-acetylmuramoyl-L-alanine amidase